MSKIDPTRSPLLCANGGPKKCRVTCDECKQVFKNRSTDFGNTNFTKKSVKVKCQCQCHKFPGIKHVVPCCENGWIETDMPELHQERKFTEAQKETFSNFPTINKNEVIDCPKCEGTGEIKPDVFCTSCVGSGIKDFDADSYEDGAEQYARQEAERTAAEHKERLQKAKDKAASIHGWGQWINVTMNIKLLEPAQLDGLVSTVVEQYHFLE